jgi:hypothetical protein
MEELDYFLHLQMKKFGESLNNLSTLIADYSDVDQINKGLEMINQELMLHINLSLDEITNIALDHFIATITIDSIMDNKNLDSFANLLFYSARLYEVLEDKETSKRLFHRSLIIYKFLLKVEKDFPYERHLRIKELSGILLQ